MVFYIKIIVLNCIYLNILNFATVPQNGKTHLKLMEIKITHMQSAFLKGCQTFVEKRILNLRMRRIFIILLSESCKNETPLLYYHKQI